MRPLAMSMGLLDDLDDPIVEFDMWVLDATHLQGTCWIGDAEGGAWLEVAQ